jgi:hypothetical protein
MMQTQYTDQPYCAVNNRSATSGGEVWTCVITASTGGEGSAGEQVYSVLSEDQGRSWSVPVSVEAGTSVPGGLPNAYANIVLAGQRLYTVYNYNRDNIKMSGRDDELGFFYMRYSDDDGRTWSTHRYLVPYPDTWVDRHNNFNGTTHIMWTVDHIKHMPNGAVAFAFTKIGRYVQNPPEEVFFMSSLNLMHASNASEVTWELLPRNADHGLKAPAIYDPNTTVMEEGHLVPMHNGGCYAMARTDKGFLAAAWTKDPTAAAGWQPTALARYWDPRGKVGDPMAPLLDIPLAAAAELSTRTKLAGAITNLSQSAARVYSTALKNSRGPFTPKRQPNGQYLLIWYNNRASRDPYFLSAGREVAVAVTAGSATANAASNATTITTTTTSSSSSDQQFQILWSQPELVLYDRVHVGTSAGGYPVFVNGAGAGGGGGGGTFITVSQKAVPGLKSTAYIHRVDEELLNQLFGQFEVR